MNYDGVCRTAPAKPGLLISGAEEFLVDKLDIVFKLIACFVHGYSASVLPSHQDYSMTGLGSCCNFKTGVLTTEC